MDTDRTRRTNRADRTGQPPVKQILPVTVKKFVSVATIFKKPRPAAKTQKVADEYTTAEQQRSMKSWSSPRHLPKATSKVTKKNVRMHPLSVAFKETSDDYRRHLYCSATAKINNTLERLLQDLYESTLKTVSSDANGGQDEPLRLSVPAMLEREAHKLYLPISAYQVRLSRTNTDSERISLISTLDTRMQDYEEHVENEKAAIEKLNKDWETIVGEIWKLGVHCLGEAAMESMLFTNSDNHDGSLSSSKDTAAASILFVPEYSTPPPTHSTRNKKRVTFQAPDAGDEAGGEGTKHLDFLHQPTRLRQKHPPATPALPEQEIKGVILRVKRLGSAELEEYHRAERDYESHWQKKTAQLVRTLMEE